MGYDLHIHRRESWAEQGADIPYAEWAALVENDNELTFEGDPALAVWRKPASGNTDAVYDYRDGSVVIKNPDKAAIAKTCQIAERLGARVQGDEGEFYGPTGPVPDGADTRRAPRWLVWGFAGKLVVVILIVAIIRGIAG